MLVLTRRKGQSIVIGDTSTGQVVVTVLEVKGEQVRLGITAPRDVQVYRDELLAAPAGATAAAATAPGAAANPDAVADDVAHPTAPPSPSDSSDGSGAPPRRGRAA